MYEHRHQFLNKSSVPFAKSWWLCDSIAIKCADTRQLSITIVQSTGLAHLPWLYIGCSDPKRPVSLSEVQPPFALELH